LLNLHPELQTLIGKEPIDLLRAVGNKPVEQQKDALVQLKEERAAKEEATRTTKRRAAQGTAAEEGDNTAGKTVGDYGVITGSAEASTNSQDEKPTHDERPSSSSATAEAIPVPRADLSVEKRNESPEQQARRVPFDRPGELALLLDVKVESDDAFFTLLELLNSKAFDRDPVRARELAQSLAERAAARAG
jgi:ParB family chromosome partitioning protein